MRGLSVWFPFLALFLLFPMIALAEANFELIPRISISWAYNDNIYLDSTNEESDNLTMVSPGIRMIISSLNKSLNIDYAPTWVSYDKNDQYDTVRHSGNLNFAQDLTEHLSFNLTDTYLKSEEPLEETEEVEGIRRTRNSYQRNTGSTSLRYLFGPENALTFGYRLSLLVNEDPTLDDGTIQNPFTSISYWLDLKNGLELNYGFTKAIFWRDDEFLPGDDYDGHAAGIRYIHRFTPRTSGSIRHNLTTRNFEGDTVDYEVHESALGFEHSFSPDLSLFLEGGFFVLDNERGEDKTGFILNALLRGAQRFERGSFTIGARSGWDEAYLEAERRGFTRYWSADARLEYQLMQRLNSYVGGSFRRSRDLANREWETWRGNCGLKLELLSWFFLSLDYSHAERDDDVDTEDYRVNSVMLTLTASKPAL